VRRLAHLGYSHKLKILAQSLWDHRYVLFKAEERMTERQPWGSDHRSRPQVGRLRSFLGGVWHIFEDSHDEPEAHRALLPLKAMPVDPRDSKPFVA
jgi:hypothetical protein